MLLRSDCILGYSSALWLLLASRVQSLTATEAGVSRVNFDALHDPCCDEMRETAPEAFSMRFATNYGSFVASCKRNRAPVWVDRVYNLARLGYYDHSFFFRVLNTSRLKIVQFGTNGDPRLSNIYNWSSTSTPDCAILEPQPPDMPRCMAGDDCQRGTTPLSNTYGTLVMSTSSETTAAYPDGVTWNATAELFINTGENDWLDPMLFVPICTVDEAGMQSVLRFPSYGEVADLGGPGPSLGLLYERGNEYIEQNSAWHAMAKSAEVYVSKAAAAGETTAVDARGALRRHHLQAAAASATRSRRAVLDA